MISHLLKAQSIALYGSHARGDADGISDSDLLVVDQDPDVLSKVSTILHLYGFSCATYTWEKLSQMAAHGSLFLQHLKSESIILRDCDSRLGCFLQSFQPSHDYTNDIEATKQVMSLTAKLCEKKSSIGWACDVLAVAVRNIGILELANRGQYEFSLTNIYDKLIDVGILRKSDVEMVLPLRLYKSLYRSRQYDALPNMSSFKEIQRIILRCFHVDCDYEILSSENLAADLIDKSNKHTDKYCRSRLLEGAVIPCIDGTADLPYAATRKFLRLIEKQDSYNLFCRDLSIPLRDTAMAIIDYRWGDKRSSYSEDSLCYASKYDEAPHSEMNVKKCEA